MIKILLGTVVALGLLAFPVLAADHADNVKKTQEILKEKGYYRGQIDGIIGPQTRAALRRYQHENDLPVTGRYTRETAGKMGLGEVTAGEHFENAGDAIVDRYSRAGHAVKKGTKEAGRDLGDAEITAGAVDFGKGVGHGAKQVGIGTKDAAVSAAKGTAEATDNVADRTADLAKKGYKNTKKGVKKAGNAVVDAFDGHNENKDKPKKP